MDLQIAKQRLAQEHEALHQLLLSSAVHVLDDREVADEHAGTPDSSEALTSEGEDDAVVASLQARLTKVHDALDRIQNGTYGLSVRSGELICDERLDADPAAELTVEEATL